MSHKDTIESRIDLFSQDFWTNWRETSGFNEFMRATSNYPIGRARCHTWVDWVDQYRPSGEFPFVGVQATGESHKLLNELGFDIHVWIESRDGKYIADGTAGQIDPSFPFGFYGTLQEASPILRKAYTIKKSRKIICLSSTKSSKMFFLRVPNSPLIVSMISFSLCTL